MSAPNAWLGYAAIEVVDKITPADISDPQEVLERAQALSLELATPITPGFEALVFKASRGIEDIYVIIVDSRLMSTCHVGANTCHKVPECGVLKYV